WVLVSRWYARASGRLYAAERLAEGERTQSLLAGVGGAATVRAFRRRGAQLARIDRRSRVAVGAATAAALYFLRLFDPIGVMLYLLDEAQSAGAALARLVGVADMPAPPAPLHPRTPAHAGVRLRGIRHAYD